MQTVESIQANNANELKDKLDAIIANGKKITSVDQVFQAWFIVIYEDL